MTTPVLYLDTNHLSVMARRPHEPANAAVLTILERGEAQLALSLLHLQELSAPTFIDRPTVGAMLDRLPVLWAINIIELFNREVRQALQRVLVGDCPPLVVFCEDLRHAWDAPGLEIVPRIAEQLEIFASRPDLRARVAQSAAHGAWLDAVIKTGAAVLLDPAGPVLSRIREMDIRKTPSGIVMTRPYPAEELLAKAGGLGGFPAYNVFQQLHRIRLGDARYATSDNDLIDEWHACYYPYADLTALDRRTVSRCAAARLPGRESLSCTGFRGHPV